MKIVVPSLHFFILISPPLEMEPSLDLLHPGKLIPIGGMCILQHVLNTSVGRENQTQTQTLLLGVSQIDSILLMEKLHIILEQDDVNFPCSKNLNNSHFHREVITRRVDEDSMHNTRTFLGPAQNILTYPFSVSTVAIPTCKVNFFLCLIN
jgi:hypothetical protein